jgi:hypothetical protein
MTIGISKSGGAERNSGPIERTGARVAPAALLAPLTRGADQPTRRSIRSVPAAELGSSATTAPPQKRPNTPAVPLSPQIPARAPKPTARDRGDQGNQTEPPPPEAGDRAGAAVPSRPRCDASQ